MTVADLKTKLDNARVTIFGGELPTSLASVADTYMQLAALREERGLPVDDYGECIDFAIQNTLLASSR